MKRPPGSESELRADWAVLNDWNGDRGLVQFTPNRDIPVWEGKVGQQKTLDDTGHLPGGQRQYWIQPGSLGPGDGDWLIGPAP